MRILITLLIIVTFQTSISAQATKHDATHDTIPGTKGKLDIAPETKQERKQEKKIYSLSQFGRETFLFIRQPLRWKGSDWLDAGIVVTGTALLTLADQPLRNASQGKQHYFNSLPIEAGRIYGEWYSIGGVAGIFGIYGLISGDTASKKVSIELLQAGIYSEAFTEILKMIVGRARPYMNEGSRSLHPFTGLNNDYNSFPSGHSTSAFALSTVMSRHAHSDFVKFIAYLPAGLTLFSRIYQDKHWVSDELTGAAIGFFVGNWVVDLHESKRHRINVTSISPPTISVSLN